MTEEQQPFRADLVREYIAETLDKFPYMPENLCIHGYRVQVKQRTLKRRTTIVKHSRFLRNLEVTPVFPPEPEPVYAIEEIEGEGSEIDEQ